MSKPGTIVFGISYKGEEKFHKVKKTATFEKLFKSFADENNVLLSSLTFRRDDVEITSSQTPQQIGLKDRDTITVVSKVVDSRNNAKKIDVEDDDDSVPDLAQDTESSKSSDDSGRKKVKKPASAAANNKRKVGNNKKASAADSDEDDELPPLDNGSSDEEAQKKLFKNGVVPPKRTLAAEKHDAAVAASKASAATSTTPSKTSSSKTPPATTASTTKATAKSTTTKPPPLKRNTADDDSDSDNSDGPPGLAGASGDEAPDLASASSDSESDNDHKSKKKSSVASKLKKESGGMTKGFLSNAKDASSSTSKSSQKATSSTSQSQTSKTTATPPTFTSKTPAKSKVTPPTGFYNPATQSKDGDDDDSGSDSDEEANAEAKRKKKKKKRPQKKKKSTAATANNETSSSSTATAPSRDSAVSPQSVPKSAPAPPPPPAPVVIPIRKFTPQQVRKYGPILLRFARRILNKDIVAAQKEKQQLRKLGRDVGPWKYLETQLYDLEWKKYRREVLPLFSWIQIKLRMNITKKTSDVQDDSHTLLDYNESLSNESNNSSSSSTDAAVDGDGGIGSVTKLIEQAHVDDVITTVTTNNKSGNLNGEKTAMDDEQEEEDDDVDEFTEGTFKLPDEPINKILISQHILDWIKVVGDKKLIEFFKKRLIQLANGEKSYALSKTLKHHPLGGVILETKLNKGQRILYSVEKFIESENELNPKPLFLVWFVSKHDAVPKKVELIDNSYRRKVKHSSTDLFVDPDQISTQAASSVIETERGGDNKSGGGGDKQPDYHSLLLVDPGSNNMMRTYWVRPNEVEYLGTDWKPPLQLTATETMIVELKNSVLLLGRGGTGKTYCLCSRIHRDQVVETRRLKCLFVAYTDRLKQNVKYIYINMCCSGNAGGANPSGSDHLATGSSGVAVATDQQSDRVTELEAETTMLEVENASHRDPEWQKREGRADNTLDYYQMRALIRKLYNDHVSSSDLNKRFPESKYVDYPRFRDEFWIYLKQHELKQVSDLLKVVTDPLTAWTQIYSFIKGSVESLLIGVDNAGVNGARALSREQFEDFKVLAKNRCRLTSAERTVAYSIFEEYTSWLKVHKEGGWDETDIVMAVLKVLNQRPPEKAALYNKMYVDEVQDFTQAEISVLMLCTNRDVNAFFLAGDTAQSITSGVSFRFEEVRSCFDKLKRDKKESLTKVRRLTTNFRSHQGILRVANVLLNILDKKFQGSLDVMVPDCGLATGPKPGFMKNVSYEDIVRQCVNQPNLKLLTWDGNVSNLKSHLDEAKQSLLRQLEEKGNIDRSSSNVGKLIVGGGSSSNGKEIAEVPHEELSIREIQTRIENTPLLVLGFRAVKGLEFEEVAIVDFFTHEKDVSVMNSMYTKSSYNKKDTGSKNASSADTKSTITSSSSVDVVTEEIQKVWRWYFNPNSRLPKGMNEAPKEIEIQMKILYTAITRARSSLLFIERICDSKLQIGSWAWYRFLIPEKDTREVSVIAASGGEDYRLADEMKPPTTIDKNSVSRLPDEWRLDGVTAAAELIDENTDVTLAIQILQDNTILCFHHSNMTDTDDLFVNAMNHLKALKAKELLIKRRAAKISGGESTTVDEATTTALSTSSQTKEMEESLVTTVVSNNTNTYMHQEDKGLLKACEEQINKFLKEMSNKDDEFIAAEACRYFFQLGMYQEINRLFSTYCRTDPARPLEEFTKRITRYFDDNVGISNSNTSSNLLNNNSSSSSGVNRRVGYM